MKRWPRERGTRSPYLAASHSPPASPQPLPTCRSCLVSANCCHCLHTTFNRGWNFRGTLARHNCSMSLGSSEMDRPAPLHSTPSESQRLPRIDPPTPSNRSGVLIPTSHGSELRGAPTINLPPVSHGSCVQPSESRGRDQTSQSFDNRAPLWIESGISGVEVSDIEALKPASQGSGEHEPVACLSKIQSLVSYISAMKPI